ncbi:tetratricopeptide repeat protein [Sphingomonas sp. AP4-R1]|uniref:2OG-Fe(II) oxygenase family protein n=1 Tax=Sphingomonas sp. AP4-R1 TaxID=2735134 RepID=UPI001493AA6F|nr:2OG-Fe(II) oxygenase family protein [Sphingomonas sp. AP4-R1]QJU57987.1 tetratricopeptide repeat protein [Sphingomonas sp. AP4-R1]
MTSDPRLLQEQASRLKAAGRLEEALAFNLRAVAAAPASAVAEHNLASTLGDLTRFAEAEEATGRAFAKGLDAPETWLVRARALQGLGRLDEAEAAYLEAIARRAAYLEAQRDLAQLRWMRTADANTALVTLEATMRTLPTVPELAMLHAKVLINAGEGRRAIASLKAALARSPDHAGLHEAASRAAADLGDAAAQLDHAIAALRAAPSSAGAARAAVEALLHMGRAGEAEQLVQRILPSAPNDQGLIALLSTAWLLQKDSRHAALCEDPAFVSFSPIVAPTGWPSLDAFLAELGETLRGLHGWRTHPLEQSLRHGSQTQIDLARSDLPVLRALFAALDAPIRTHIGGLGTGADPLRARPRLGGDYRILGAWSVLLQPGGRHVDHVHPEGWLSSAFYVDLPDAIDRGREGWLSFGRPGIPTTPRVEPFRAIRPEPGHVALFPSYLWHGTEPFAGDEPRLTVAFDLVPA